MAIEFDGSTDDLKALLADNGIAGEWTDDGGGKLTFRGKRGGVLNYWENTGRVQCQGPADKKATLEGLFKDGTPTPPAKALMPDKAEVEVTTGPTRIFIVHGHDTAALEQLELVLRRLKLEPYILQNNVGQSRTIIEALEHHIYKDTAFGIVLMTPDDFGYPKASTDTDRKHRARQNVILELGMLFASLGRHKMVILKKGALELPSDIESILRLDFKEHVKEVAVGLARSMKSAGIFIDDALIPIAAG